MKTQEQRKFNRKKILAPCLVYLAGEPGVLFEAKTVNISLDGLQIISQERLLLNSRYVVMFTNEKKEQLAMEYILIRKGVSDLGHKCCFIFTKFIKGERPLLKALMEKPADFSILPEKNAAAGAGQEKQESEKQERRKYHRYIVRTNFLIYNEDSGLMGEGILMNFSSSGFCLLSKVILETGFLYEFELDSPSEKECFAVIGRVAWQKCEIGYFFYGIDLLDEKKEEMEKLKKMILSRLS